MRVSWPTAWLTGFICLFVSAKTEAQIAKTVVLDSSHRDYRLIIPGKEYGRSGWHQFLWGNQYRKEWTTPVKVKVMNLDTAFGGLKAVEQGGGRQTKTLRLEDKNGRQYVVRTIDKDYGGALPEIVHGTWIEKTAKDEVSTAHPFAAVTIAPMIAAAGVYHTNPEIVYIPYTPGLGKYNETFAGMIALIERRPDENQEDYADFGYSKDVKGTDKMLEKLWKDNKDRVDQQAFVRARLFDMFVGDWGRHEDQWRWASFDTGEHTTYKPIPRDRDQVYTRFNGFLLHKITSSEALEHLTSFSGDIKNVKKYNFPPRYLDRQLLNELPREAWVSTAQDLQNRLTDTVIAGGIRRMPPEMFAISGQSMIDDLQSRRNKLTDYANKYYKVLAKEVDVVGTKKSEQFVIDYQDNDHVKVSIYDVDKDDKPRSKPYYDRTFLNDETHEIRIYGLEGHDQYQIKGDGAHRARLRIVGGIEEDKVVNTSRSSAKITYYDNPGTSVEGPLHTRISSDTAINRYEYMAYKPNSGNVIKSPWYSNVRGFFIKGGYQYTKQQWRKEPFGWKQQLYGIYSISNRSFGGNYFGQFNEVIGKLNLLITGRYDQRLNRYFYGYGNEVTAPLTKKDYQYFLEEGFVTLGLNRNIGKYTQLGVNGIYQRAGLDSITNFKNFYSKFPTGTNIPYKSFGGAELFLNFAHLDENMNPMKGFVFQATARRLMNLDQTAQKVNTLTATTGFYLPLVGKLSLASKFAGTRVTGNPEFYQLATLGGNNTIRGYQRERYSGTSSLYNMNDLRFIFPVKSRIMNGKMGLIGFVDEGKVYYQGLNSHTWHVGYGGGLMVVPFNKISISAYYGTSKDGSRISLQIGNWFE